nr:uncharacterized protein LOC110438745 isoform X2 [Danio rerio]|eukprot:XP_021327510.1 uncharacterized protein LOC110438745 isoform X2 [Danio rerio]
MMPSVFLLYVLWALCPLSVGLYFTCPSSLNLNPQQGSEKLCATLQLQRKFPCLSLSLSVSDNEQLSPETWHLESLSVKVEKNCSFMVIQQNKQIQHFPGGSYSSITINFISTHAEFLCICTKLHIRSKRAPTHNDFLQRHVLKTTDNPDNNFWERVWSDSKNVRKHLPHRQSFMALEEFNKIKFTKKFPIEVESNKTLYRSDCKIDIYYVNNENGLQITQRYDYVVAKLDNNNKPVHFENAEDISEHLEKMEKNKILEVQKVNINGKTVLKVKRKPESLIKKGTDKTELEKDAEAEENKKAEKGGADAEEDNKGGADAEEDNKGGADAEEDNKGGADAEEDNKGGADAEEDNKGGADTEETRNSEKGGVKGEEAEKGGADTEKLRILKKVVLREKLKNVVLRLKEMDLTLTLKISPFKLQFNKMHLTLHLKMGFLQLELEMLH